MALKLPVPHVRGYGFVRTSYCWGEEALCGCGETFVQLAAYECCRACYEARRLPGKGKPYAARGARG